MNLANKLTVLRIMLVPIFLICAMIDTTTTNIIALSIFIIASATDKLDGYIARSRNQITNFGKFMDPLADKLLVTCALILLVEKGIVAAWVVVVIIAREFIVSGLRTLAASQGVVIAASNWGKLKTVIQMIAIIMGLLSLVYNPGWLNITTQVTIYLAAVITIGSGVDYFIKGKDIININE
ncbi:CDP-diacylglycerol--glycerol-3-phosphate 3-phosphatidyltransferase [Clostridium sulfidigenes]|uniref:CDP-diacylglycerol--glycerol-3-phosphate 3-phosphatidyltransferase n=1 Tax=Clostridium sulfidigenes TaxID=318464 RepID=A0A084JI21_9CLOT|nr:CDP-diacylglycerol--glycerol-3-phosphate 3-phosphatidyltransferase [Clostridium sulfidigenes]KEZ88605.1 CDP-diacylglycerol--glycerol-3-phosphate 3-phosphatidyltransferase [Clostridium sulfidigenes]HAR86904.1 CDP-diacylglycerol--glycerol-3-phosphate 3-phosphatidyltransferase [Clostridium sp.]